MAAPATEEERELLVQGLMSLQTGCDEQFARHILKKHAWNADQAAAALLDVAASEEKKEGEGSQNRNMGENWMTQGALNTSANPMPVQRQNSVIDLTGDDDEETTKALVASLEPQPVFGPSNRVDDAQRWAVVPSNAPPALSQEDQALNRALEASLSSSFVGAAHEPYEEPSDIAERVRKDGWPTAFRSTHVAHCYAPVVLQCLLSLPHLRARLLRCNISCEGNEDQHVFTQRLQRLAATLDHSARAYVSIDEILEILVPIPSTMQDTLFTAVLQYYSSMAYHLGQIPQPSEDPMVDMPLFSFEGMEADVGASESSSYSSATHLEVIAPSVSGNDLVSCLGDILTKGQLCLTQLSECIAFLVRRHELPEKTPFKYPSRIYFDRYMRDNLDRANELQNCQEGIQHEAQRHATDRLKLSNWKNADTLKDLRSSVRYFETVAADGGDPIRKEAHERSKLKLLKIIKQIEENIQRLTVRYQELTADAQGLFDKEDLQKHGYDLQAVIMHDGLYGRKHVYSYTKDEKGRWWKILDYQITEVTEDIVLNDPTGFHLGAGPLLLLYSQDKTIDPLRTDAPEQAWPRITRDLVRQDNYTFVAQLPTEVADMVQNNAGAEGWLLHDDGLDDSIMPDYSAEDTVESRKSPQEIDIA